jgi:uncharacterized membrane protein
VDAVRRRPLDRLLGTILYLVVTLIRRPGRGRSTNNTPIEILKQRYARGGLSRDEYERIRRDLAA